MYHCNDKTALNIELIWLLMFFHHLFQPNFLSSIWLVDLMYCLINLLFLIFHYYAAIIDLRLSINFFLCSGVIYLSWVISLSFSFLSISELFCREFFEILRFFYISLLWYYFSLRRKITKEIAAKISKTIWSWTLQKSLRRWKTKKLVQYRKNIIEYEKT